MGLRTGPSLWMGGCVAVVAATGCGGGQGGGAVAGSQLHTAKSGDAVITYFGQPKPQLATSSGSVTVTGLAGASFNTVTLEPPPNLADTYLVFSRRIASQAALYELPYFSGAPPTLLYQNQFSDVVPGISAYGTVAFNVLGGSTNQLDTIRPDGTGLRTLSFSGLQEALDPAYSVDGTNRLAFACASGSTYNLYVGPGTGGTPTLIQTSAQVSGNVGSLGISWSPSGSQVAFEVSRTVGSNTLIDLFSVPPTGSGTAADITPGGYQWAGQFSGSSWSSDGATIATTYQPPGGTFSLSTFSTAGGILNVLDQNSAYNDYTPCFSPDGSKIAFYRSANGGATAGIYVCDAVGGNTTLVAADPGGTPSNGGLAWSPFLPKETVVAASGSTFYHQAASGFLLSQNGSQFGSLIAFKATTPTAAAIQAPTSVGTSAPLAFTLTADAITSVGYINNYFSPGTTITLSSTPSVLVTIDAVTGQVDLVAPASVAKPSYVTNSDGTLSYSAPFKALYDSNGHNLAPQGASKVTVNPKTGKLIRFQ